MAISRVVPMSDLDSALEALDMADRRVLVIKNDVEGYEPAAIAGVSRTLARTDAVVLEYSPDLGREDGLSAVEMVDRLRDAGFAPHCFVDGARIAEIAMDELRRVAGQMDVIWLRRDSAEGPNR